MLEQVIMCKLSTLHAGSYVKVLQKAGNPSRHNTHKIMTNNILGFIATGFNALINKFNDDDDDE
jgi:hypothetical protein